VAARVWGTSRSSARTPTCARTPPPEQRARAWKLGEGDATGMPVKGGWAAVGSVMTDGVSLCVPRMRLRGQRLLDGEGGRPPLNPPRSNPYIRHGHRYLSRDAMILGGDPGIVTPMVVAIPKVGGVHGSPLAHSCRVG
jgi:hypothetical protein